MANYPLGNNVNVNYSDDAINSENPGFGFGGTETGALWCEHRVIAGVMYCVQNATWNKYTQSWVLVDSTKAAYGWRMNTSGVLQTLSSPAGTTPFTTWTVTGSLG